jgi:cell division control protein 6
MTTTDDGDGDRDPLFRYDNPIFANEDLLRISHLPSPDRIVGRDEHMQKVAEALNPAIFGQEPTHLLIFGKTGTGKSLISRSVAERVCQEARRENVTVESAFIDCGEQNTEASVVKTIARELNDLNDTGIDVPQRGLGTSDYYERLWNIMDLQTDVSLVILDEIDLLENDEVLRKLSRAGENRRITDSTVGIIGISNKIDYPDQLNERVKSSFAHDELVFQPYDANQLINILENRAYPTDDRPGAFHEDTISEDVVPLTAAFAAQEHGDARKAIDILRNAGRIAVKADADQVTEDHVRKAKEKTEVDRLAELIEGAPTQAKAILLALTVLTEERPEDRFSTNQIYQQYQSITQELDMDMLSERRVQEILQEQDFLNVIDSEKEGRGRGRGVVAKHRLLEGSDIVKRVLYRDSRLSGAEV